MVHDGRGLPQKCTYLLGSVGEVRIAETAAWLRFDWCVGCRLGTIDFRRSGAATSTTHVLLSLGAVVASVRFDSLMGTCGMVASEVFELIGLGVRDIGRVLEVVIDELLIGHVDQWTHVDA